MVISVGLTLAGAAPAQPPAAGDTNRPGGAAWRHPAGLISREMVAEMRAKCERQEWARQARDDLLAKVAPWLETPLPRLRELMPRRRTNVYHNFSCPADHSELKFDPFDDKNFVCPRCGKTYPPGGDPRVYPPGSVYHGTFYDGWGCMFFQAMAGAAEKAGLAYVLTGQPRYAQRAADILLLFAELIPKMPRGQVGGFGVIFTYHREGDNKMLTDLASAYELIREAGALDAEQKRRIEKDLLKRFCDDVVRDPEYRTDWNNVYQWLLCVMQVGVAIEDRDYLDYAFGLGHYAPAKKPQHRSLAYVSKNHFKPDGAFWELCSGYHLYPLAPFCRAIVFGRGLARQEPERFPPEQFDATDPRHPLGNAGRRALRWYISLSLPDYTMSMLGDAPMARDSLKMYDPCAELGYRYFGIAEAAEYPEMTNNRGIFGLIYGAEEIRRRAVPFDSARLGSGFAALRQEARGNQVYAGINYLLPGGSHQHADRLELLTYARDRLLGFEKGNPYNEMILEAAGRQTFAHNTLVVDKTSQKKGDLLRGGEIPQIHYFQNNSELQYAEVWGDRIYPQTRRYRRSVALVAGVIVDVFEAAGGKIHDWIYHCDGDQLDFVSPPGALLLEDNRLNLLQPPREDGRGETRPSKNPPQSPVFADGGPASTPASVVLQEARLRPQPGKNFDPPAYLVGGAPDFQSARTGGTWSAVWTVAPETNSPYPGRRCPIRHRLTMLGGAETEVFHLQTYPAMKQVHVLTGLTHTVLARRVDNAQPFVSVLDTYGEKPELQSVLALPVDLPGVAALRLVTAGGTHLILFNPEPERVLTATVVRATSSTAPANLSSNTPLQICLKGRYGLLRLAANGGVEAAVVIGGTELRCGDFSLQADQHANLCLTKQADGTFVATSAADLAYETVDGQNLSAPCGEIRVTLSVAGRSQAILAPARK